MENEQIEDKEDSSDRSCYFCKSKYCEGECILDFSPTDEVRFLCWLVI